MLIFGVTTNHGPFAGNALSWQLRSCTCSNWSGLRLEPLLTLGSGLGDLTTHSSLLQWAILEVKLSEYYKRLSLFITPFSLHSLEVSCKMLFRYDLLPKWAAFKQQSTWKVCFIAKFLMLIWIRFQSEHSNLINKCNKYVNKCYKMYTVTKYAKQRRIGDSYCYAGLMNLL